MLNYIWGAMIVIGIIFGAVNGKMPAITNAALDSAKEAVTLCITMLGVMSLWTGLMEIAKTSGLIDMLTRKIEPFIHLLFPRIPKSHPAKRYIATNIIANVLGLGWAATPAGLKAMEALTDLERERGNPEYLDKREKFHAKDVSETRGRSASNEMCTFLILNISSLQLIPVNMIAYRSQYGSVNPAGIIVPAILATFCSTIAAIIYCKIKDKTTKFQ